MTRPGTLFISLLLVVAAAWLLLLGLPGRRDRHAEFGLPALLHSRSAASLLGIGSPGNGDPELLARAARAAVSLESALVQFAFDAPSAGHLARTAARLLEPTLVVPESDPPAVSRGLGLRPVAALGEHGRELLRLSERNLDRWPEAARRELSVLIETQNGISRLLLEQSAARGGEAARRAAADRVIDRIRSGRLRDKTEGGTDLELAALCDGFERRVLLESWITLSDRLDRFLPILQRELTPAVVRAMKPLPEGGGVPRDLLVLARIEAGLLLIGGVHTTVLPQNGAALTIDLGGDDRWVGGVSIAGAAFLEPLTRVCIDLSGNDRYEGRGGQLAACTAGLSMLLDLQGDDTYESDGPEFGAALFGAAVLIDRGGRDSYRCRVAGLGFGLCGVGLLFDAGEDDRYQTECAGLGCGLGGGAGVLVDHWGDDLYLALGQETGEPGGTSGGAVLGAGYPLSPGQLAGSGLLLDRRGSDVYRAGNGCLGSAEGGGLGCALDGGGDDLYSSGDDSLGSGKEGGFGYFRDLDGDDEYLSRNRTLGFGAAGVGLFIDDLGHDRFLCLPPSQGVGIRGGAGLHADLGGH